jgi:hypothetical protein
MTGPESAVGRSAIDFLMAGWLAVLAMLAALVSVFFLPWHIGSMAFPISALLGAGVVFWTIRASYQLTGSMLAALFPALLWFAICAWLTTSVTLGFGLVIGDWRAQSLLGLGALAAAIGLGTAWGGHVNKKTRPIS